MIVSLLLQLLVLHVGISSATLPEFDYCKLNCGSDKNTMCNSKCSVSDATITAVTPNYEFRKSHLHWHNYYRNLVAGGQNTSGGNGPASNMRALSYDLNLEFTCLCWLVQAGRMYHDKCRGGRTFKSVGQNLCTANSSSPIFLDYSKHIETFWVEELVYTKADWIDKLPPESDRASQLPEGIEVGHFTQLAWAETTHVGCAATLILVTTSTNQVNYLIGCNYGPSGNIIGQAVYKRGRVTSACPAGTKPNKDYPNLCGENTLPPLAKILGNQEFQEIQRVRGSSSIGILNTFVGMLQAIVMSVMTSYSLC